MTRLVEFDESIWPIARIVFKPGYTEEDWAHYCDHCVEWMKRGTPMGLLNLTIGTTPPSAAMRARAAASWDASREYIPNLVGTAVVTDSMALRTVLTAFAWLARARGHSEAVNPQPFSSEAAAIAWFNERLLPKQR